MRIDNVVHAHLDSTAGKYRAPRFSIIQDQLIAGKAMTLRLVVMADGRIRARPYNRFPGSIRFFRAAFWQVETKMEDEASVVVSSLDVECVRCGKVFKQIADLHPLQETLAGICPECRGTEPSFELWQLS